jgi:hypothetical protein
VLLAHPKLIQAFDAHGHQSNKAKSMPGKSKLPRPNRCSRRGAAAVVANVRALLVTFQKVAGTIRVAEARIGEYRVDIA